MKSIKLLCSQGFHVLEENNFFKTDIGKVSPSIKRAFQLYNIKRKYLSLN